MSEDRSKFDENRIGHFVTVPRPSGWGAVTENGKVIICIKHRATGFTLPNDYVPVV